MSSASLVCTAHPVGAGHQLVWALDRHARNSGLTDGILGGDLILGCGGNQIPELQIHVVDQVFLAFGKLTRLRLTGLGNGQLEIFDDCLGIGELGVRDGGIRLRDSDLPALGQQRCAERFDVIRKSSMLSLIKGNWSRIQRNRRAKTPSNGGYQPLLSGKFRAEGTLRITPVDSLQQKPKLPC